MYLSPIHILIPRTYMSRFTCSYVKQPIILL